MHVVCPHSFLTDKRRGTRARHQHQESSHLVKPSQQSHNAPFNIILAQSAGSRVRSDAARLLPRGHGHAHAQRSRGPGHERSRGRGCGAHRTARGDGAEDEEAGGHGGRGRGGGAEHVCVCGLSFLFFSFFLFFAVGSWLVIWGERTRGRASDRTGAWIWWGRATGKLERADKVWCARVLLLMLSSSTAPFGGVGGLGGGFENTAFGSNAKQSNDAEW